VYWLWQWNYTQFNNIMSSNESSTDPEQFVGSTVTLQRDRAAALGRIDYDNIILQVFSFMLDPFITAMERVIGSIVNSAASNALSDLYTTYIECDYQGALQCRSATLGIGLFDAMANVILVIVVISTIASHINIFLGVAVFTMLIAPSYYATMWIAYGASPLCTLPSTIGGIPGIPTCLPADIYTLVSESLQQCPLIPVALIAPADFAEANVTLCTTCGVVPDVLNCAEFGFLNGLDVIFYTAPSIFGDTFNPAIANLIAPIVPAFADVANLYTPAYIASLGQAGVDCNAITSPSVITAAAIIALIAGALAGLFIALVLLVTAAVGSYLVMLMVVDEGITQIDEGFVQGVQVDRLKLKTE
jgi:hypothetical protein